jgi:hypothetical protein
VDADFIRKWEELCIRNEIHVRLVSCHDGMMRPQVADGGEGLQLWTVTENILDSQSQTADKGGPPS